MVHRIKTAASEIEIWVTTTGIVLHPDAATQKYLQVCNNFEFLSSSHKLWHATAEFLFSNCQTLFTSNEIRNCGYIE